MDIFLLNLYAWVYNETKEKNCLFDEALCHIGFFTN